jgi:hypothetical protein
VTDTVVVHGEWRSSRSGSFKTCWKSEMEEVDLEGKGDGYSGTFRWKKTKILPTIPKCSSDVNINAGWMEYLLSRFESVEDGFALVTKAQKDLCMIDCLSTPVSIGKMCITTAIVNYLTSTVHIVCIGASSKTEGRIFNETNAFDELINILPKSLKQIYLYLVGPEMKSSEPVVHPSGRMNTISFQGTSTAFFRQHIDLLQDNTIVVGLNCGFGNWENPIHCRYDLLFSWLPDLYFLTGTKLPLLFTCANDYADLEGEVKVMNEIMGTYFLTMPQENSFSYASTMVAPNHTNDKDGGYSRGNSFWYAVQGCDKGRRVKLTPGDINKLLIALATRNSRSIVVRRFVGWVEYSITASSQDVNRNLTETSSHPGNDSVTDMKAKTESQSDRDGLQHESTSSIKHKTVEAAPAVSCQAMNVSDTPVDVSETCISLSADGDNMIVTQLINEGKLQITLAFSKDFDFSKHSFELNIDNSDNETLVLSDTQTTSDSVYTHRLKLIGRVNPNSVRAKQYKKKYCMLISAELV